MNLFAIVNNRPLDTIGIILDRDDKIIFYYNDKSEVMCHIEQEFTGPWLSLNGKTYQEVKQDLVDSNIRFDIIFENLV